MCKLSVPTAQSRSALAGALIRWLGLLLFTFFFWGDRGSFFIVEGGCDKMKAFAQQRPYLFIAPCILFIVGLLYYWRPQAYIHPEGPSAFFTVPPGQHQFNGSWNYERDRDNWLLSQGQCDQAFPDLFADIDRARDARSAKPITLEELDSIEPRNGYIRAMIYDQQVSLQHINQPRPRRTRTRS